MEESKSVISEIINCLIQTFSESDNNLREKAEKRLRELCKHYIINKFSKRYFSLLNRNYRSNKRFKYQR